MSTSRQGALVTGSTDGIGLHTAIQLAKKGYRVGIHGRSQKRLNDALSRIRNEVADAELDAFCFDLSLLKAQKHFCAAVLNTYRDSGLHLLFNNAGVFMNSKEVTGDGLEVTFSVNVVAVFTIFSSILPLLRKASQRLGHIEPGASSLPNPGETATSNAQNSNVGVRILNVSSISMEDGPSNLDMNKIFSTDTALENIMDGNKWNSFDSYGISKRFVAMLSLSLSECLRKEGMKIPVLTCDPGTVNTKMLLAGWGACGIHVQDANTQLDIMTVVPFDYENLDGKYWNGSGGIGSNGIPRRESMHDDVLDKTKRDVLWHWLINYTGVDPANVSTSRYC